MELFVLLYLIIYAFTWIYLIDAFRKVAIEIVKYESSKNGVVNVKEREKTKRIKEYLRFKKGFKKYER